MRIEWAEKNIFMNYDEPAYIIYDTEGQTVRLKIYEIWDSNQAIYVDDTATSTNRSGKSMLRLWSTNPRGTPSTTVVNIYFVTVEIYDTSNRLIETRKLSYAYTRKGVTTLNVKDENNNALVSQINYVTIYNNERFFKTYYGTSITIPYPDNPTQTYLEVVKVVKDKKYYLLDRLNRIAPSAGTYNIKLLPKSEIIIYMDVELSNTVISTLLSIPGLNYLTSFLLSLGTTLFNYGLTIGNYVGRLLSLEDYYIVRAEKISDNPPVIRLYFRTDIAPILVVLILGLAVVGTVITWIVMSAIRDMRVAELSYETEKVITQRYTEYARFITEVWEWAQTQADPSKAFNEIVTNITPPPTPTDEAKNTIDPLTSTIETLKSFLLMAVVVAVVLALITYLRK